MAYDYQTQRPYVFTEEGSTQVLKLRDRAQKLIELAGACSYSALTAGVAIGSTWDTLACVDRLIELGYLKRIDLVCAQYDLFYSSKWAFQG